MLSIALLALFCPTGSVLPLAAQPPAPQDPPLAPAQTVEVSWSTRPETLYAGQTFELVLRVNVERDALEQGLLQLFPQALGLPLQVAAFDDVERLELAAPPAEAAEAAEPGDPWTLAVDGSVRSAVEVPRPLTSARDDGPDVDWSAKGTRRLFEITRAARAPRPGALTVPAARVHYATATAFREDFVRGRVPLDRTERDVVGRPLRLNVLAVPEADRPPDYGGAVGSLSLASAASPRSLRVGESLLLDVTVLGASPLDEGIRPRFDSLDGFTLRGSLELPTAPSAEQGTAGRTFRFDLAPTELGVDATPGPSLTFFDPAATPPGFRTVTAAAVPIVVRQAKPGEPAPDTAAPSAAGSGASAETPARSDASEGEVRWRDMPWTLGVLTLVLGIAVASVIRRQRARDAAP